MTNPEGGQHADAPRIPGYRLIKPIGEGLHSRVWKAWRDAGSNWAAVKVFDRKAPVDWPLWQRQVASLTKLDTHPRVVSLYDVDLSNDQPYSATELLEAGSLERFLNPMSPVPVALALHWLEDACTGLSFVHSKGLIHGNVRPGNILLDGRGHVRIGDVGQARLVRDDSALRSLCYMAPEQAVEEGVPPRPDVRWDVFGLGATAYALLTGIIPRADDVRAALIPTMAIGERLRHYRAATAVRPMTPAAECTNGRVPEDVSAVVAKCLETQPARRYGCIAEVQADLAALRESRPVSPLADDRGYRFRKFVTRLGSAAISWRGLSFPDQTGRRAGRMLS